jgi:hypothetical protein
MNLPLAFKQGYTVVQEQNGHSPVFKVAAWSLSRTETLLSIGRSHWIELKAQHRRENIP